jgi:hypothetical protein
MTVPVCQRPLKVYCASLAINVAKHKIVASQMAKHLSTTLNLTAKGTRLEATKAFAWKNMGSMVFIGDNRVSVSRYCSDLTADWKLTCYRQW